MARCVGLRQLSATAGSGCEYITYVNVTWRGINARRQSHVLWNVLGDCYYTLQVQVCEACSSLLLKAYLAGRFTCICHLIFPPQHNTFTHRRSIAERGGCFSALSVCLFVCLHDNFRTIKRRTMKRLGALYKNLARVCMSRSKVKAQGRQGQKTKNYRVIPTGNA